MSANFFTRPGHYSDPNASLGGLNQGIPEEFLVSNIDAFAPPVNSIQNIQFNHQVAHQAANQNVAQSGILNGIESFVLSARQLEGALNQERARGQQLQEEIRRIQGENQRIVNEQSLRSNQASARENQLKLSLQKFQENDRIIRERFQTLSTAYNQAISELTQYKQAWSGVLEREREARQIIQDGQRSIEQTIELQQKNKVLKKDIESERIAREQLETHVKSYQKELQSALTRLHSAEAQFSQLSKEFELLQKAKQSFDEESSRVERRVRQQMEWELIHEREKVKEELMAANQKEMEAERERLRIQIRSQLEAEYQDKMGREKSRFEVICEGLESEVIRIRGVSQAQAAKIKDLENMVETQGAALRRSEEIANAKATARSAALELERLNAQKMIARDAAQKAVGEAESAVIQAKPSVIPPRPASLIKPVVKSAVTAAQKPIQAPAHVAAAIDTKANIAAQVLKNSDEISRLLAEISTMVPGSRLRRRAEESLKELRAGITLTGIITNSTSADSAAGGETALPIEVIPAR